MSLALRIRQVAELHGEFTLRSGKTSDIYFDKYRFECVPELLEVIAGQMASLIPEGTEVLCGLEMGGIPVVTMLSHITCIPAAFVRKEAKAYGTCNYAEGAALAGKRLLLVEDVVSSGGAIVDAVSKMRDDDYSVGAALCVIDREAGGKENLQDIGVTLISLFTMSDIVRPSGQGAT